MGDPTFWDDPEKAQKTAQDVNSLKEEVDGFHKLSAGVDDLEALQEMAAEENDESLLPEMDELLAKCRSELEHLELGMLLSGEYDANNAILTLHAGAGGTEAQDWTSMLLRMFTRFAEQNGFALEMLDYQPGDEAGVKSATIQVNGHNAYGFLRSEKGVHRLVRISPFNAQGKRQTSFVSLDVMPDIEGDLDVDIDEKDLRIDLFCAGGAGGQHVNKTESAVRMTHLPTGLVAVCQDERSQIRNREKCFATLKARILDLRRREEEAKAKTVYVKYNLAAGLRLAVAGLLPMVILGYVMVTQFGYAVSTIEMLVMAPCFVFYGLYMLMKNKLHGSTGDCCGALFLLTELSFYLTFVLIY